MNGRNPFIYLKDGRPVDDNGYLVKDWRDRIKSFKELYIIDIDGILKNEPNLDFYKNIFKKIWIDSFPRRFEDVMDLVICGGEKIVIRDGIDEKEVMRIFENVEVDIYLIFSEETKLMDFNKWKGFVYLLDRKIDFRVKEILTGLENVYIVARHKEYLELDDLDDIDIKGVFYPLWEMER